MRAFACAALALAALAAVSGAASARVWTDPAGRVSFDAPNGWSIIDQGQANITYVIAGTANNECHVLAIPRETTATVSAVRMRDTAANDATFTPEIWTQYSQGITSVFRGGTVQVLSHASEKDGRVWPIQRADLQSSERVVHAALQMRPGLEVLTFCQTYEGADTTDAYDALIRSVATPNDAAWQAEIEAAPAPAAPPAQ